MAGNTIVVHGKEYQALPLQVDNWLDNTSADYKFKNQKRTNPITEIIVHETVTRSHDATLRVLKPASTSNPAGRNLGVHFIIEADGTCYQHGDLADDMLWHAGPHNGPSFGIEVVNPYDPKFMPANGLWKQVIDAPWAVGGKYVVPTLAQCEALACILSFGLLRHDDSPPELQIPEKWVGLKNKKMRMGAIPGADKPSPGIYAHHYFAHADGCFLVLYSWLRIEAGMDQTTAYQEAIRRSTGARATGVDLSDIFAANPYIKE